MFLSKLAARERELLALNDQLDSDQAGAEAAAKEAAESTFRLTEAALAPPSSPPRSRTPSAAREAGAMSPSTKAAAVASARRRNRGFGAANSGDAHPLAREREEAAAASPAASSRRGGRGSGGVEVSGLGVEAESRVQQARIKALERVIEEKTRVLKELRPKVAAARKQSEAVEEQRDMLQSKAQRAEQLISAARAEAEEQQTLAAKLEDDLLSLQRGSAVSSRGSRRGAQSGSGGSRRSSATDVRLNRTLQQIGESRKLLKRERNQSGSASERLTRTQESVRVLQKHRSELLAALRKQARLVDVLRRQTMMIEAANTLSFTEREFEDVMDMAAAAGSW